MLDLEQIPLHSIFNELFDGLYIVDIHRTITFWNKAAERISGFSADEVVGKSCADNILCHVDEQGNHLCTGLCPLAAVMRDCIQREVCIFLHHRNGHRVPVSVRVSPLRNRKNEIIGGIELFTDISYQRSLEFRLKELEQTAHIDILTRLPNRNFMEQEFNARLAERDRTGIVFGLLFADADHFKNINDTYGHEAGDAVLRMIAGNIRSSLRPFDVFGRWGGEEFIGIISNINSEKLFILAERLRIMCEKSFIEYKGSMLTITLSIGATLCNTQDTVQTVLQRVDRLLYKSKSKGRNRTTFG